MAGTPVALGPGRPIDRLNERQKQCLRFLFANLSIKEIGAELGVSPFTVKGHLREARRLLGVNRSMQAARLLVEHERDTLGIDPPKRLGLERRFADDVPAASPVISVPAARIRYPYGPLVRIGLIVAIAFGAVALAGALLVGSDAITRIFQDRQVDISDYPYRQ